MPDGNWSTCSLINTQIDEVFNHQFFEIIPLS